MVLSGAFLPNLTMNFTVLSLWVVCIKFIAFSLSFYFVAFLSAGSAAPWTIKLQPSLFFFFSNLRQVVWIAELSESSNLWTQIELSGYSGSMSVWESHFKSNSWKIWIHSLCCCWIASWIISDFCHLRKLLKKRISETDVFQSF